MRSIIDILESDHDDLRELLRRLLDTTAQAHQARPDLLAQIEEFLSAHTKIEEEIFYPAVLAAAENEEQQEMIVAAIEEHRAIDARVLPDLKETPVDTIEFGGRAKVLGELFEHHADEEEDEMFELARELMDEDALRALGEQAMARKRELLRELRAA